MVRRRRLAGAGVGGREQAQSRCSQIAHCLEGAPDAGIATPGGRLALSSGGCGEEEAACAPSSGPPSGSERAVVPAAPHSRSPPRVRSPLCPPRPLLQAALGAELARRRAPSVRPPPVPFFPSYSARATSRLPPAAAGEERAPWSRRGEGAPGFPSSDRARAGATWGAPGRRGGGGGASAFPGAPGRRGRGGRGSRPCAALGPLRLGARPQPGLDARPAPRIPRPAPRAPHSAPCTERRIPAAGHVAAAAAAAAEYGREPLPQARRV